MKVVSSWNLDVCKDSSCAVWRVVEGVVASFWITAAPSSARFGIPAWKERVLEYPGLTPALNPSFFFPFWTVVLFFMDMTYQCLKEERIMVEYSIDLHGLCYQSTSYLNESCKAFVRVGEYLTGHILRVLYCFFVLASKRILGLESFVTRPGKQISYLR